MLLARSPVYYDVFIRCLFNDFSAGGVSNVGALLTQSLDDCRAVLNEPSE